MLIEPQVAGDATLIEKPFTHPQGNFYFSEKEVIGPRED
jgi:hypothetical protein